MRAPVFGHGQLRLYLLALLAERPMHGYELIQALSDRFGGTYAPSAGTIYPRLARLQQEGLIRAGEREGRRTVHTITAAGRDELAARGAELAALETDVDDSVQRLADGVRASVDEAMRSLRADLAAAARQERPARADRERPGQDRERERRAAEEASDALTRFRLDLRTELRAAAATGRPVGDVVPLLLQRLAEVEAEVRALLRRAEP